MKNWFGLFLIMEENIRRVGQNWKLNGGPIGKTKTNGKR